MHPDARAAAQKPQTEMLHKDQRAAIRWRQISLSEDAKILAK
jgi:hypothetical protein